MAHKRTLGVTAVVVLALAIGAGGVAAFAPRYVISVAEKKAAAKGLKLSVGSLRWGLAGPRLLQSRVKLVGVAGVDVRIPEIEATWARTVTVPRVLVEVRGDWKEVSAAMDKWRASHLATTGGSRKREPRSSRLAVNRVNVEWKEWSGPGSVVQLQKIDGEKLFHEGSLVVETATVQEPRFRAELGGLEVIVVRDHGRRIVKAVTAQSASLVWKTKGLDGSTVGEGNAPKVLLGAADKTVAKKTASESKAAEDKPEKLDDPGMQLKTRLMMARDKLRPALTVLAGGVVPGAKATVGQMRLLVQTSAGEILFGPGKLEVSVGREQLQASLRAQGDQRAKSGVVFEVSLPWQGYGAEVNVAGGPVPLGSLGVREGDLGLVDVDKAKLFVKTKISVDQGATAIAIDGHVLAKGLGIAQPKLAMRPVKGLNVAVKLRGRIGLEDNQLRITTGELDLGKVGLSVVGTVNMTEPTRDIDVKFEIPATSCDDLLTSLPASLAPKLQRMRARGMVSLRGALKYRATPKRVFSFQYDAQDSCRYSSGAGGVNLKAFQMPFTLHVLDAKKRPMVFRTGPGTPSWVSLAGISRYMEVAVMTTEDAGFRRHRGFDHEAIRNSVRDNLFAQRFRRGASTISMQLAKNLLLGKQKTVSRKLQELVLTDYIEQELTKDQILELYLNVIEFGPGVYGIRNAAAHYFHTSPSRLSLSQSLYLSSILPNPRRQHFVAGGRVSQGWMNYLYKLMHLDARRGWIGEDELEQGLREWVVFGKPEPELAPVPEDEDEQRDEPEGEQVDPLTPPSAFP